MQRVKIEGAKKQLEVGRSTVNEAVYDVVRPIRFQKIREYHSLIIE
jgi:hypothetical protein